MRDGQNLARPLGVEKGENFPMLPNANRASFGKNSWSGVVNLGMLDAADGSYNPRDDCRDSEVGTLKKALRNLADGCRGRISLKKCKTAANLYPQGQSTCPLCACNCVFQEDKIWGQC